MLLWLYVFEMGWGIIETDSVINQLSIDVYRRCLQLSNNVSSLIQNQKQYTFKQPFLLNSSKTIFDRQRLKRNSVLLGVYLQHTLINQLTPYAVDILKSALFVYLTNEYPSSSFENRYSNMEHIFNSEMYVFDDIRNMKHPLHVGIPDLPNKDSLADNEFYRLTIWLIENSLIDPSPLFDAIFVAEIYSCISTWFMSTIEDIRPSDFVF